MSGDLSDHDAQALGDGGFAGDPRIAVLRQHAVEDRVGNLVADLVGVAFSHRFGGQQVRGRGAEGGGHATPNDIEVEISVTGGPIRSTWARTRSAASAPRAPARAAAPA